MKIRKKLEKNEIYFTIISSILLSIMAIIISYNSYKLSSRQTSIIEFESKPDFVIYKTNQGTDSLRFNITYDDKKFKNLYLKIHLIIKFELDSILTTYNNFGRLEETYFLGRKEFPENIKYSQKYDFKKKLITINYSPIMENNFQNFENQFNKKYQTQKGNGYKLNIIRKILFELEYSTVLNNKVTELYSTELKTFENDSLNSMNIKALLDNTSIEEKINLFYENSEEYPSENYSVGVYFMSRENKKLEKYLDGMYNLLQEK